MRKGHIADLQQNLTSGRIDRRQFIASAVAAGVALPAAFSMTDAVLAATPKKGGRLRQGFSAGSTTETLDALKSTGSVVEICNNWCWGSNLTEVQPDGSIGPELAESIEASDKARTWVFKLRKGVTFHNGKSLTPEDVIDSVNRHRGEDSASAGRVAVRVHRGDAQGRRRPGGDQAGCAQRGLPLPAQRLPARHHALRRERQCPTAPAATGPAPTSSTRSTPACGPSSSAIPDYFKADRAHFDEIEHLVILDTAARQNALTTGAVDVIDAIEPKTAHLMARVSGVQIQEVTGTQNRNMVMRLDTPPFDNLDLRLAIKLSAKRQELVDKIEGGHGVVGNDHHISPAQQYYNTELPQREYDPDKARFHLKKAGMEGIKLELLASKAALEGAADAAILLKESAAAAGIDITVKRVPADGFWSNVWNKQGTGIRDLLLGRPADQRLDVHDVLRGRVQLERFGLEGHPGGGSFQRADRRGALRAGREQAAGDVLGVPATGARGQRLARVGIHELPARTARQRAISREGGRQLDARRRQEPGALVVRLDVRSRVDLKVVSA